MRFSLFVALAVALLGCKSKDDKAKKPKKQRAFTFKKSGDKQLRVTETIRVVMPVVPGTDVLQPLGEDQFGRGYELRMCTADKPDASAKAVEKTYAAIGWKLSLKPVPTINGWHITGSSGTLVLSATTRGPNAKAASQCTGDKTTMIIINVRNPGRSAMGWARAAAKAGKPMKVAKVPYPVKCPAGTKQAPRASNAAWCVNSDGIKHGPMAWLVRRKVALRGAYDNGKLHGEFSAFVGGKVVKTFKMVNGNGTVVMYHSAKVKSAEMGYRDGKRHGGWRHWHENGKLRHVTNYDRNWEHGLREDWDKKGVKRNQSHIHQGRNHGITRTWDVDGKPNRELHYVHGRETKDISIAKDGKRTVKTRKLPDYTGKPITTSHAKVKREWQQCKRHDECVSVPTTCCSCGGGDLVGVHYKFKNLARPAVLAPGACKNTKCPAMKCASTGVRCHKGMCATTER